MAKTPLRQISRVVNPDSDQDGVIQVSKIDVPHTQIQNRAQIIDLENDLSVNFGVNRIMTQDVQHVENELGPQDERVFRATNDQFDQIRFVGDWYALSDDNGTRANVGSSLGSSYVEITFYGTGLNVLAYVGILNAAAEYSIDGGAYISLGNANASTIISARSYSANTLAPIAKGLALKIHTIKIRQTAALAIYGFEVVNETATLEVKAGHTFFDGIKAEASALSTPYNSDFTNEYGTAGVTGGNVLVYMDKNGNIKKDIQYTDIRRHLSASDHSSEDLVRKIKHSEFGGGRSDDFSSINNNASYDRYFTLDDGTTTLTGNNMRQQTPTSNRGMVFDGNSTFIQFTFVGTGVDIILANTVSSTSTYQIFIDAIEVTSGATIPSAIWPTNEDESQVCKIASGLPYGTHTVKILCVASNTNMQVDGMIIYQPKKPALPESYIELSNYNLMADFVADTNASINTVSTGTLRKANSREFVYTGVWTSSGASVTGRCCGVDFRTTTAGGYMEYTFFGTGFDFRLDSNGTTTISVDGNSDLSSYSTAHYGTGVWTDSAGTIVGNLSNSEHIVVEGLPLGLHTFRATLTSGTGLYPDCLDIITPVHSRKDAGPYIAGDTIDIGSCAMQDLRPIPRRTDDIKTVCYTIFGVADPSANRAENVQEFMFGWQNTIKTNGNPVEVYGELHFDSSGGSGTPQLLISILVDGKVYGQVIEWSDAVTGLNNSISFKRILNLDAGYHHIKYVWTDSSNTDDIRLVGGGTHVYAREL